MLSFTGGHSYNSFACFTVLIKGWGTEDRTKVSCGSVWNSGTHLNLYFEYDADSSVMDVTNLLHHLSFSHLVSNFVTKPFNPTWLSDVVFPFFSCSLPMKITTSSAHTFATATVSEPLITAGLTLSFNLSFQFCFYPTVTNHPWHSSPHHLPSLHPFLESSSYTDGCFSSNLVSHTDTYTLVSVSIKMLTTGWAIYSLRHCCAP